MVALRLKFNDDYVTSGWAVQGVPMKVLLDHMPDVFWDTVRSGGGDIRCHSDAGVALPRQIMQCDVSSKTGSMWVLMDMDYAGPKHNVLRISFDGQKTEPSPSSPFGSENVWEDYVGVYHFYNMQDSSPAHNHLYSSGHLYLLNGVYEANSDPDSFLYTDWDPSLTIEYPFIQVFYSAFGDDEAGNLGTLIRLGDDAEGTRLKLAGHTNVAVNDGYFVNTPEADLYYAAGTNKPSYSGVWLNGLDSSFQVYRPNRRPYGNEPILIGQGILGDVYIYEARVRKTNMSGTQMQYEYDNARFADQADYFSVIKERLWAQSSVVATFHPKPEMFGAESLIVSRQKPETKLEAFSSLKEKVDRFDLVLYGGYSKASMEDQGWVFEGVQPLNVTRIAVMYGNAEGSEGRVSFPGFSSGEVGTTAGWWVQLGPGPLKDKLDMATFAYVQKFVATKPDPVKGFVEVTQYRTNTNKMFVDVEYTETRQTTAHIDVGESTYSLSGFTLRRVNEGEPMFVGHAVAAGLVYGSVQTRFGSYTSVRELDASRSTADYGDGENVYRYTGNLGAAMSLKQYVAAWQYSRLPHEMEIRIEKAGQNLVTDSVVPRGDQTSPDIFVYDITDEDAWTSMYDLHVGVKMGDEV